MALRSRRLEEVTRGGQQTHASARPHLLPKTAMQLHAWRRPGCGFHAPERVGLQSTPPGKLTFWKKQSGGLSQQDQHPGKSGTPPNQQDRPGAQPVLPQGREAKEVPDRGSRRRCLARSQGPRRELRGGRTGLGSPAGTLCLHRRHRGTGSRPNSRAAPRRPEPGQAHLGAAGSHVRRVSTPTSVVCVARPWSCTNAS